MIVTLPLLLLMQGAVPDCAAGLRSRGYGTVAAAQVRPYADCLNGNLGTEQHLLSACEKARHQAANYNGTPRDKARVTKAINWLDAMVHERAVCETTLKVES